MRVPVTEKKEVNVSIWAVLALLGAMLTTALDGTGLAVTDITTWSKGLAVITNVVTNPYKLTTVVLVAVAFFFPKPTIEDKEVAK